MDKSKENLKFYNYLFLFVIAFFLLLISINLISSQELSLKVTEEHPFLMGDKWISAKELKVGDFFTTADGKKVKITEIEDVVLEDKAVDVYNLEALPYNDFVVADGNIVVHNSNKEYPLFELEWKELESVKKELIYIDEVPLDLANKIRDFYNPLIGKNYYSAEDLNNALARFSKTMYDLLPFLGFDNINKAIDANADQKALFSQYLKLSECSAPKLSELIKMKQLDCTGQCLAIRESLGGKNSGWELYHELSKNGKKRAHTFLAKEIEINNKKYMIIIDPLEVYLYKGNAPEHICKEYIKPYKMIMEKEYFLRMNYPKAEIK